MPEELTDDQGTRFTPDQQAPLTPDLRRASIRRNLVDAHFLLILGLAAAGLAPLVPPPTPGLRDMRGRCLMAAISSLSIAGVRYAGVGPKPRSNRRNLLKRRLCPVCLQPLEGRNASGETITCSCGAMWERRYM
jgi:hypothetical protein